MEVKYRKNSQWNFVLIACKKDNIYEDINMFFNKPENIKKYGEKIDIIETEMVEEMFKTIKLLVKFAIV